MIKNSALLELEQSLNLDDPRDMMIQTLIDHYRNSETFHRFSMTAEDFVNYMEKLN